MLVSCITCHSWLANKLTTSNPEEDKLMTDIFDDIFDEAGALGDVDTQTGKTLSDLVRKLRSVEKEIEDAEAHVKALKQEKHKLSVENIPALMDEMGVERLDVDGVTVVRKMMVHASIPSDRKDEAFGWLRSEGLDDIIKNDVTISFGKGEDNVAGDLVGRLEAEGYGPSQKTYVHPSTLKAFVKERFESGKPIDLDMFGAFVANAAEIRRK
jgi:hypothetical protein